MMKQMTTRHATRRWIVSLVCLISGASLPTAAVAQELEIFTDARLEGYGNDKKVILEDGNLTLPWLGFGLLSAIALLGMFKDAKRSHLN
jgi:hypothetical protein